MIKAIVFDYGNVISTSPNSHTKKDIADAYAVSENEVGILIGKYISEFRKGKITEDKFWQNISQDLDKPVPNNTYDLWRQDFKQKLTISEPMIEFVKFLKKKGIIVAVLSNNIMPYVEVIKEKGGYNEFDVVINSCEVGFSKPEPEIYRLMLNKLNINPGEILYLDDRPENLDTAKQFGINTMLITNPTKQIEDIKKIFISI